MQIGDWNKGLEQGDLEGVFQPKPFYDYHPILFGACQATPGGNWCSVLDPQKKKQVYKQ